MSIRKTDRKAQMMDAGTAMFDAEDGIGTAIGYVRRVMERHGEVASAREISEEAVPSTTGDFDLFLDFSSPWRKRYISCKVEDAGDAGAADDGSPLRRYAAVFKEGNRSTPLRAAAHILLIAALLASALAGLAKLHGIVLSLVLAGLVAYRWIVPSTASQRTVFAIQHELTPRCTKKPGQER